MDDQNIKNNDKVSVAGKKIKIVTHSSGFHTDDVFAVATLLIMLGENADVEIIRSRDMEVIKTGDYVVDVGGVHDPVTNRFDHHQAGGAGKRENDIPYASFGLVAISELCRTKTCLEKIWRGVM